MTYHELALAQQVKLIDPNCEIALHLNARSVGNKQDEIVLLLKQFSVEFTVFMLTETWYQSDSKMLQLPGYELFFLSRLNKRGGGVAICTLACKRCRILPNLSGVTDDSEVLTIQNQNQIISVVYRPPNSNMKNFTDYFDQILEYASLNKCSFLCSGDFNTNTLDHTATVHDFNMNILSCGFVNLI